MSAYTCRHCGTMVLNPFPRTYEPADTCPTCWKLLPPEERKRMMYVGEPGKRTRDKLRRARRIAADMEAHPIETDAIVSAISVDIFFEPT